MYKHHFACLFALALVASACGTLTREGAIEDMVDEGISESTAECVIDDFVGQGFEPNDAAGDELSADVDAALTKSFENCFTAEDIGGLANNPNFDPEEFRQDFIDEFVAGGSVNEEQAVCILDGLDANGITLLDLSQAGLSGDTSIESAVAEAAASCIGG